MYGYKPTRNARVLSFLLQCILGIHTKQIQFVHTSEYIPATNFYCLSSIHERRQEEKADKSGALVTHQTKATEMGVNGTGTANMKGSKQQRHQHG